MPASVDSYSNRGWGHSSLSWTHAPVGNATSIVVFGDRSQEWHSVTSITYGNLPLTQRRAAATGGSYGAHLCLWSRDDISGRDDDVVRVVASSNNYAYSSLLVADSSGLLETFLRTYAGSDVTFTPTASGLVIMHGNLHNGAEPTSDAGQTTHLSHLYRASVYNRYRRHDSKHVEAGETVGMNRTTGNLAAAALVFGDIAASRKRNQAIVVM